MLSEMFSDLSCAGMMMYYVAGTQRIHTLYVVILLLYEIPHNIFFDIARRVCSRVLHHECCRIGLSALHYGVRLLLRAASIYVAELYIRLLLDRRQESSEIILTSHFLPLARGYVASGVGGLLRRPLPLLPEPVPLPQQALLHRIRL